MKVEIRSDKVVLEGYVNATEKASRPLYDKDIGRFREYVDPGVFSRSLQRNASVQLKFNHKKVIGDTIDGTVILNEDAIGLYGIIETDDPEVREAAENNRLQGWSFGMIVNKQRIEPGTDGIKKRYLEDIDLLEVSLLTRLPAYIAMSLVEKRESGEEVREFEDMPEPPKEPEKEPPEETATETVEERDESRAFLIPNAEAQIEIIKLRGAHQ